MHRYILLYRVNYDTPQHIVHYIVDNKGEKINASMKINVSLNSLTILSVSNMMMTTSSSSSSSYQKIYYGQIISSKAYQDRYQIVKLLYHFSHIHGPSLMTRYYHVSRYVKKVDCVRDFSTNSMIS